ncbi:hypothetical protein [Aquipseudomonas alcaligenes]|uniref:Uncharacterized protein n=1 Tax=Aquipseudomonas alcaligenes (strain ATCC 14909 / DSM 50342 / CCUG 1425 / JCM 20561 / NBRC 14159 / NCIMB 9945 / NCTC 10367 / 1577) TaxID=1215092 RepID=U2ZTR7_AQUA1|nr:hypothetical protein [Pseudomonas alcaligenes]GAD64472.1 hypothetical protein PA6_038_00440 [Pseudomonas alcaligenes NBRC 14159]SUD20532.1 Uncharacterised protein [Pseudomonas alcaligenes]
MKTTLLKHHKSLGYLSTRKLSELPVDLQLPHECSNLVTFRGSSNTKSGEVIKNLHAAVRPISMFGEGSYCFFGIQSDSPLAPLLLWDAAHFLSVGQKLTVIEDTAVACYLDRDYFCAGLVAVSRTPTVVTYEKVAKLPAEGDDDLDSWTFGIPVGPEDATVLNAVVKRILEIDIPNKEIILCGSPGKNFAYFDQVRIVGEDITAPPVQICKKKNRLAIEAKYNNLVILHDRVFLPKHFGEMVRRFGPRYPLMTLQSMFFDNRVSMHPRRYSDYGLAMGEIAQGLQGLHRTSSAAVSIAPSIFTEIERTGFCFASPMRFTKDMSYPTGSLYVCRKEVWNAFPLDEALFWVEFEDIEQGLRAGKAGVPSRVNPFGITQSVTSRALLGVRSPVEMANGKLGHTSPNYFSILNKKPLFKVSTALALSKLRTFANEYVASHEGFSIPTGAKKMPARDWVELVNLVVQQSTFENDIESVRKFIADYEKLVLLDQLPNIQQDTLSLQFLVDPVAAKQTLITSSSEIRNMLYQRPYQSWFYQCLGDYFHHNWLSLPGIVISAVRAYAGNGKVFYFESLFAAVKAIYNSTPFSSYVEKSK